MSSQSFAEFAMGKTITSRRNVVLLPKEARSGWWDLYKNGLDQGIISVFTECPEKTRLSLVQGLNAPGRSSSEALDFGTVCHAVMEDVCQASIFHEGDIKDFVAKVNELKNASINQSEDKLKVNIADNRLGSSQAYDDLEMTIGLAQATMDQYFSVYPEDIMRYKWVSLEKRFDIPYIGPVTGKPIMLKGRIDGILRIDGKLWLFETKTKGQINEQQIVGGLSFDVQVCMYMWAIEQLYGEKPAGVIYNVVRRPQLRKTQKENLIEFLYRVENDVKMRKEFYFMRFHSRLLDEDYARWLVEFDSIMGQMERWVQGEFHYRNSFACTAKAWGCEYLELCGTGQIQGYTQKAPKPIKAG